MNDFEVASFYRETVVALARTMPLAEAVKFLRGALIVAGEHEAMTDVRKAYVSLAHGDQQLELIASGQLKLNLGGAQD